MLELTLPTVGSKAENVNVALVELDEVDGLVRMLAIGFVRSTV